MVRDLLTLPGFSFLFFGPFFDSDVCFHPGSPFGGDGHHDRFILRRHLGGWGRSVGGLLLG